jgi:hypothetical protein
MHYKKIDKTDFLRLIQEGLVEKLTAVKDKTVVAEILTESSINRIFEMGGYPTVCYDDEGNPFVETVNKNIRAGDYLVANVIDGRENCYVINSEKFESLYDNIEGTSVYRPKGELRTMYRLPMDMNVSFIATWGSEMKVRGGGVLIEEGDSFYGINPEEFKATYTIKSFG